MGYITYSEENIAKRMAAFDATVALPVGKKMIAVVLEGGTEYRDKDDERNGQYPSHFKILFEDGEVLSIFDADQQCCEVRYFSTDDDLTYYEGAVYLGMRDVKTPDDVDFVIVTTSLGEFTVNAYNEHNGYYAGISLEAGLYY